MKILVLGAGNLLRGDDGFGVRVIRELAHKPLPDCVRMVEAGLRVESYVAEMPDYDHVIIVDSINAGLDPGAVVSFTPDRVREAKTEDDHSLHGLGALGGVRLLESLGECPPVTIIACQRGDNIEGEKLSYPVGTAVKSAVNMVEEYIRDLAGE